MIPDKVLQLIPKLESDHDGEIVATVKAITRVLKADGLDLHDLVNALRVSQGVTVLKPPPRREQPKKPRPENRQETEPGRTINRLYYNSHNLGFADMTFVMQMKSRLDHNKPFTDEEIEQLKVLDEDLSTEDQE